MPLFTDEETVTKKATLIIRQAEISRVFPDGIELVLEDEASVLDAIKETDEEILKKYGRFPVEKCRSLLQMVYHPREDRFYKQVAVQAYTISQPFLDVRQNLRMPLPDGTTIILVPEGGCTTDWEEPIN